VIIMIPPQELSAAKITEENRPDTIINEFRDLLNIFPERK
jgi:hypothetical protein